MNTSITDTASWQKPAVLRKALGRWAARDDTRPDPKARAAADDALAAIDATVAELAALRARLLEEMARDAAAHTTVTGEPVEAEIAEDKADGQPPATGHVFSDAVIELESEGYEPAEAYSILFSAEQNDAYRDDTVTVTMAMDGTIPRYTIAATPEPPASFPAAVHSAAGLVDDPEDGQDAGWTDAELAGLPPMFAPARVGPWPYARAA